MPNAEKTKPFRIFLVNMYMANCDERLLYKQERNSFIEFVRSNLWWLKKLYRETQKGDLS